MRRIGFRLGWQLATNDGRCVFFWALTGLMLLFSVFYGPGEPLLTRTINQEVSGLAKISDRQNLYDNLWWDADKSLAKTSWSAPPVKFASEKSWWPWIITALLFVISVIYTPVAKREEALAAGKEAWDYLSAKQETEDVKTKTGEEVKQVSVVEKISQQVGWKRLLSFDMLGQFAGNFIQRWLFRKR